MCGEGPRGPAAQTAVTALWGCNKTISQRRDDWLRVRNRRDRERSDLASDGAGARGYSLDRGNAESVLQRPEERALKKHSSRESGGASGPVRRTYTRSQGSENAGSDPLDTQEIHGAALRNRREKAEARNRRPGVGECRGRAAETRGAGPKETQQQGGERSQWAPIAGQSTPTPIVGAKRIRDLTLWTHRKSLSCTKEQKGDGGGPKPAPRSRKPRREVAEPGPNRRDWERSGLAGDGAGAGGRSLGRRRAEGVLQRPEERTPKKHGSKEAGGVSGPRPQDNRARSRGRENTGSDPLDT
ncbi:hypothetical protein NDU88_003362 [Pleurodeles waltl]|uniref:Uncharacterized protein n=1 Tax=Pleurodeles waltl TaxID=8319 RepID=A0AAV7TNX0_PLEWA|nr:hypothetical protein NDU88_003362 [Pleurodeles waltl]